MAILVSGCETVQPQPPPSTHPNITEGTYIEVGAKNVWPKVFCNNYIVNFISDPPGAKIEVDNFYVGVTPCSLRCDGYYDTSSIRMIKAYPTKAGQYLQTKIFGWGDFYPPQIYFNMDLGPVTPSIDVDVNQ